MFGVAVAAAMVAMMFAMAGAFGVSVVGGVLTFAWLAAAVSIVVRPEFRVLLSAFIVATLVPILVLAIGAAGSDGRWWSPGPIRPDSFALATITPEREIAIAGAFLLGASGEVPEGRELVPHFRQRYDEMAGDALFAPSPFFTPLTLAPDGVRFGVDGASTVVVFLHGKGGNFGLNCYLVARAVGGADRATVCPTLDFEGNWAPDGGEVLRATLEGLRAGGAQRIVLAGLSNGAIGASVLASKVDVDGVLLIAGISAYAKRPAVPALVVAGRSDPVAPPGRVDAFDGAGVEVVWIGEGHFAFLTRYEEYERAIRRWFDENFGELKPDVQ